MQVNKIGAINNLSNEKLIEVRQKKGEAPDAKPDFGDRVTLSEEGLAQSKEKGSGEDSIFRTGDNGDARGLLERQQIARKEEKQFQKKLLEEQTQEAIKDRSESHEASLLSELEEEVIEKNVKEDVERSFTLKESQKEQEILSKNNSLKAIETDKVLQEKTISQLKETEQFRNNLAALVRDKNKDLDKLNKISNNKLDTQIEERKESGQSENANLTEAKFDILLKKQNDSGDILTEASMITESPDIEEVDERVLEAQKEELIEKLESLRIQQEKESLKESLGQTTINGQVIVGAKLNVEI